MRKIPNNIENPIDNILLNMCEDVSPTFYNNGYTPNMITTLSNISTIIVVLLLLNANYIWAAIFYLIAYFFDCLDGHYARKYNMVTVFGDYYDHISDSLKIIAVLSTMYYINSKKFMTVLPILIIFFVLAIIHFGCQELYYNSTESESLEFTKKLCPVQTHNEKEIENKMHFTKYFGMGTLQFIILLCIIYYKF
jgi:phosphatidylglycerophosphate synthase